MRVLPIAVAVTLLVAAAGCGGGGGGASAVAPRHLTDLRAIAQLRRAFNESSGEPRLIVLVSPT